MPIDMNEFRRMMNAMKNTGSPNLAAAKVEEAPVELVLDTEAASVRPKRCEHSDCNKKLMLTDYACQCKQFYCSNHRHANLHSCKFDYKNKAGIHLEKQLVKLGAEKMERI